MAAQLHDPRAAASFPRRMLAALLDGLVLGAAISALHGIARVLGWHAEEFLRTGAQWHAYLLATVSLPCLLYYAASESSRHQGTLAKRWFGLRVVDVYGARIGPFRSLVRTVVKLVPWEMVHLALCFPQPVFLTQLVGHPRLLMVSYALLGLYLSSALMTLKKQSVHDLAAGTYIVRTVEAPRG